MAYAALVSLLQLLEEITNDHYSILFADKKHHIESLKEKFNFLLSFLENNTVTDGIELMSKLETAIREAAYQAQDTIESYISNQVTYLDNLPPARPKIKNRSWRLLFAVRKVVSSRPQRGNQTDSVHNCSESVDNDLRKVEEDVVSIVLWVRSIWERKELVRVVNNVSPRQETGAINNLVGLHEDIEEIKARICGESSKLQVISLSGMGGIGKTTLARNIFDDSLVQYHFHIRAWITISQNYRIQEILLGLLNSMTTMSERSGDETEDELMERVYKRLKGMKYITVWAIQVWDDLKRIFPDDNLGSRIILTTRITDVGIYASSIDHLHQMRFLDEDESWNLLREKVFGEECCPPCLEEAGRLIAKNCQGLPLAIVVLAGLLSKEIQTRYHWENIARNVSSVMAENDGQISKILSLSYTHLPRHLKACFLYMGIFPEDYTIPAFKVVNLWIAEGFIEPKELKSLEEVAEEYLQDLVKRSLILVTKKRANGKIKYCTIHDMLRDLCIHEARDENFLHVIDVTGKDIDNKRRLSLQWKFFGPSFVASSVARSIICYLYFDKITGFKLLRVLDILEVILDSFPVEILKLIHLRYLSLTNGIIRCTLPRSIHELQNLQTLIIGSSFTFRASDPMLCAHLQIWKMPKLRHLIFDNIILSPVSLADKLDPALENLQTLSRVRNFKFTEEAISMIPNLRKLKVFYTGQSCKQRSEYDLHNLSQLSHLETLNLNFIPSSDWWQNPLPIRFGIPLNLKKLTLSGCGLPWNEMTSLGSLPKLEMLKLRNSSFIGSEWEPTEGEFSGLKILLMEWLHLKYWRADNSHFPSLERLTIRHCSALEEIPMEIGEIATLKVIEIDHSDLAADSARLILEEQESLGNDVLQVSIINYNYKVEVSVIDPDHEEDHVRIINHDYENEVSGTDPVINYDYEDEDYVTDYDSENEVENAASVTDYDYENEVSVIKGRIDAWAVDGSIPSNPIINYDNKDEDSVTDYDYENEVPVTDPDYEDYEDKVSVTDSDYDNRILYYA